MILFNLFADDFFKFLQKESIRFLMYYKGGGPISKLNLPKFSRIYRRKKMEKNKSKISTRPFILKSIKF